MSNEVECPYCGNYFEFENTGDPMGEGDETEYTCPNCDRELNITVSYVPSYDGITVESKIEDLEDRIKTHERNIEKYSKMEGDFTDMIKYNLFQIENKKSLIEIKRKRLPENE